MTDQHPITPSPELIEQWFHDWDWRDDGPAFNEAVVIKAARWGADMELEACCEWLLRDGWAPSINRLRDARRPKPKNLADKALDAFEVEEDLWPVKSPGRGERFDLIRRALKRLQELEDG